MTTLLKNLLISLVFSTISISAQEAQIIEDCVALNICFEKCADTDEACLDNCDATYKCPEDVEDQDTQNLEDSQEHQEGSEES